jgi:hypothetical protein
MKTLSVFYSYAVSHFFVILSVILPNAIILSVFILKIIMLSVILPIVIMPSVAILKIIKLSVVIPNVVMVSAVILKINTMCRNAECRLPSVVVPLSTPILQTAVPKSREYKPRGRLTTIDLLIKLTCLVKKGK